MSAKKVARAAGVARKAPNVRVLAQSRSDIGDGVNVISRIDRKGTWALKPKTQYRRDAIRFSEGQRASVSTEKVTDKSTPGGLTNAGKAAVGGAGAATAGGAAYGYKKKVKKSYTSVSAFGVAH